MIIANNSIMKLNWKFIVLIVFVTITLVALYIYKEYNRKPANLENLQPTSSIEATELIREFSRNDSLANEKYLGKLVEVTGRIKQIDSSLNHYTLVLGDENNPSSVRCNMDSTISLQKLINNMEIKIKGICTGFIPDDMGLGEDIIIERAIISTTNK